MSSSYVRLKKYREVHKKMKNNEEQSANISNDIQLSDKNVEIEVTKKRKDPELVEDSELVTDPANCEVIAGAFLSDLSNSTMFMDDLSGDCLSNSTFFEDNSAPPEIIPQKKTDHFRDRLREWAVHHQTNVAHVAINDLLVLLREFGCSSLPKTAQTLLQVNHFTVLDDMEGLANGESSIGEYKYLGIQRGLQKILDPEIYEEHHISVFAHIDGMQVYQNSNKQICPICLKVYHDKRSHLLAASSAVFLQDFVEELNLLIKNGVAISGQTYNFKFLGVIADSPPRAFLKCCKPPVSFAACERCVIEGESVGRKGAKKRIYGNLDCARRTNDSFRRRLHQEHHYDNSPILRNLILLIQKRLTKYHPSR